MPEESPPQKKARRQKCAHYHFSVSNNISPAFAPPPFLDPLSGTMGEGIGYREVLLSPFTCRGKCSYEVRILGHEYVQKNVCTNTLSKKQKFETVSVNLDLLESGRKVPFDKNEMFLPQSIVTIIARQIPSACLIYWCIFRHDHTFLC